MSKGQRDFRPKSVMRLLGDKGIRALLAHSKHPLKPSINDLLSIDSEKDPTDIYSAIYNLVNSQENTHRDEDLTTLSRLNDFDDDQGRHILERAYKKFNLDNMPESSQPPLHMALYLFQKHRNAFEWAEAFLESENTTNWQLYAGLQPSKLVEELKKALTLFRQRLTNQLPLYKMGERCHIDCYQDTNQILLDVRVQGNLKQVEDFVDDGVIKAINTRPPVDIIISYDMESGGLKIKTPRRKEELSNFLHLAFAQLFLVEPNSLISNMTQRCINFSRFILDTELLSTPLNGIKNVQVTRLRFKPSRYSKEVIEINAKGSNLWSLLEKYQIDKAGVLILEASVKFEFSATELGQSKTVVLKSNNSHNLGHNHRDNVLTQQLKDWGVLNV